MALDTIIGVRGIEATSSSFREKLVETARKIGTEPDFLATVISFESGGAFSPSIRNPSSGCVGLIQFCGGVAAKLARDAGLNLGSSDAEAWLGSMSAEKQLDYVAAYFLANSMGRRPLTLEQTYLLVFAPGFAFREPSAVAYASGTAAYDQNRGMDADGDGAITVADIASRIRARYNEGLTRERVAVSSGRSIPFAAAFAVLAFGAAAGWNLLDDSGKNGSSRVR